MAASTRLFEPARDSADRTGTAETVVVTRAGTAEALTTAGVDDVYVMMLSFRYTFN